MIVTKSLVALISLRSVIAAPQASVSPSTVSSSIPSASSSATLTTEETGELYSLHEELVNIPSISGDEVECAKFISEYLSELGYNVEEIPVGETGTFNVFAYPQELKDEGVWPEVLITSHIDTVSTTNRTVYYCGDC
jgi:acetylornithine deacetylase